MDTAKPVKITGLVPDPNNTGKLMRVQMEIRDQETIEKVQRGLVKDFSIVKDQPHV